MYTDFLLDVELIMNRKMSNVSLLWFHFILLYFAVQFKFNSLSLLQISAAHTCQLTITILQSWCNVTGSWVHFYKGNKQDHHQTKTSSMQWI